MTNDILRDLARHGDLTTTARLHTLGHSSKTLQRRIADGTLIRLGRGWVATERASQVSVLAVINRGRLAGPSALLDLGVWDGVLDGIHVQRRPNFHGKPWATPGQISRFRPMEFARDGLVVGWGTQRFIDRDDPPWRQSVVDALLYVARRAPSEQFIACVESAIHEGAMSRAALPILRSLLPRNKQWMLDNIDGNAGSGLETVGRIGFTPLAQSVETQVTIPGIAKSGGKGQIDILLDKWLAIEMDGDRWHDPQVDRRRNQMLVQQGYRIHRFGYSQVIHGWPEVEATVVELLRYPPPQRWAVLEEESSHVGAILLLPKRSNRRNLLPGRPWCARTGAAGGAARWWAVARRGSRQATLRRRSVLRSGWRSAPRPCASCRC